LLRNGDNKEKEREAAQQYVCKSPQSKKDELGRKEGTRINERVDSIKLSYAW